MGWANCGTDSKGRRIGYAVPARCDHPGCKAKIDRGLGYACGGMHGEEPGCEGYFCGEHLKFRIVPEEDGARQVCIACAERLDRRERDEFVDALVEIMHGADPVKTAKAILETWDELPPSA